MFCVGIAQYSICTSDSSACSQNFAYNSSSTSQFTLNATIIFIGSGMSCCREGVSNPVWTVITNSGHSGQQVENCKEFVDPPGIYICVETSPDFVTNIARVSISGANTTFQIKHSIDIDVDGENHLQRSVTFNFYYSESEKCHAHRYE